MGLARETLEEGVGWKWKVDHVTSLHTIQSFGTGKAIQV